MRSVARTFDCIAEAREHGRRLGRRGLLVGSADAGFSRLGRRGLLVAGARRGSRTERSIRGRHRPVSPLRAVRHARAVTERAVTERSQRVGPCVLLRHLGPALRPAVLPQPLDALARTRLPPWGMLTTAPPAPPAPTGLRTAGTPRPRAATARWARRRYARGLCLPARARSCSATGVHQSHACKHARVL